jgi:hypothetical protein
MEAQTDPQPGGPDTLSPWRPVRQLNKPADWSLTLSGASGTVVRTLTGAAAAAVRVLGRQDRLRRHRAPRHLHLDGHRDPALTLTGTTSTG